MTIRIERIDARRQDAMADLVRPMAEPSVAKDFAYSPIFLGLGLVDEAGVDGGIFAQIYWDWMVVENIAVPLRWRGRGLGRRLMEEAEAIARQKGCKGAWVSTYSRQAPEFYRHVGFEVFGRLPSYPGDQERLFLSKLFR
ncbi:GNAT family N-acetyltransferase [Fulvimarina sp. 2208YS6-2-32]|uniref:GNAT family N-acetyltransferase n=1 Tax=Fulvimarina uroteuthidis TaxID=3098149 RepID=A0ABU5I2T3_9HYPH|nr:GNAT family N-acetyltransferase [Fulvimarina sp. 2208YS6-2-32]MDY8109541.1 GNAT family N-acetyltransferase [Fulvimarina sp. 2208YS6-2-32]